MFCRMLLGTVSEFTPRAAGGIILNGGRCDLTSMCNAALGWTDEGVGGLKSSPLLGQTNYVKHLVQMVRHPSRLMVITAGL